MPNITVKKADHSTDIVWSQMQLGGGDPARPAIWQSATVGVAQSHRPEIRYYVKRGSGTRNQVVVTAHYPVLSTDTTTGITSVITRQRVKTVFDLDNGYNQAEINELVVQYAHLLADTNLESAIRNQLSVNA